MQSTRVFILTRKSVLNVRHRHKTVIIFSPHNIHNLRECPKFEYSE